MGSKELAESAQLELLIARSKNGDGEAWSRLVEIHRPPLHRFVVGLCRNESEAADIVSDTLHRAQRYLRSYDESRRFLTWLMKIAARQWNAESSKSRFTETSLDQEPKGGGRPIRDAVGYWENPLAEECSVHAQVDRALRRFEQEGTLPIRQIQVFRDRYLGETTKTLKEVADAFGISVTLAHNYCTRVARLLVGEIDVRC